MKKREKAIEAYVAMGSNIDPAAHVLEAGRQLLGHLDVTDVSTLYQSVPKDGVGQSHFINGVFRIAAKVEPLDLKYRILRKIETDLGRIRSADKCAPRTIDLDLILFGDRVVMTDAFTLPDPDIYEYNHIAVPLLEVAPHLVLPDQNRAVSTLDSATCRDGLIALPDLTTQLKGIIKHGRKTRQ